MLLFMSTLKNSAAFPIPALFLTLPLLATPPQEHSSVEVRVDQRLELLAIPFWLAEAPAFCQGNVAVYQEDLLRHFTPCKEHEAVRQARLLAPGLTWETLAALALQVKDETHFELLPEAKVDPRWIPFLKAMAAFARDSKAQAFFQAHHSFYDYLVTICRMDLGQHLSPAWFQRASGGAAPLPPVLWVSPLLGGEETANCRMMPQEGLILMGTCRMNGRSMPVFGDEADALLERLLKPAVAAWVDRHAEAIKGAALALRRPVADLHQILGLGTPEAVLKHSIFKALVLRCQQDCHPVYRLRGQDDDDDKGYYWEEALAKSMGDFQGPLLGPELVQALGQLGKEAPVLAEAWRQQRWRRMKPLCEMGPKVVAMDPPDGSAGTDPALTVLRITFDRPMDTGRVFVAAQGAFPAFSGEPSWDAQGKVLTLPVRLAPRTQYAFGLNSIDLLFFKDRTGLPLKPTVLRFTTK
jgi:hypothetical protein